MRVFDTDPLTPIPLTPIPDTDPFDTDPSEGTLSPKMRDAGEKSAYRYGTGPHDELHLHLPRCSLSPQFAERLRVTLVARNPLTPASWPAIL